MATLETSYFNKLFGSINCPLEVRKTFELVEFMAYIDYTSISIDHIVSAILYYYRDNEPDNPITKLYPANVYAGRLRKKNDTKISFTNFSSENVSYSFAPNITPDVKVLFSTLRNETLQISVPLIFWKICKLCKKHKFQNAPLLYNDGDSFENLYSLLQVKFKYEYAYSKKLEIKFGTDLTYMAYQKKFTQIIGRDSELNHILRILSKKNKNNPLLVGDPGVGKTHIVEALASLFVQSKIPKRFFGKHIIRLNIHELTAGTKYRGDLENNVCSFMANIEKLGNPIIFIDEIHTIGKYSSSGSSDLDDLFKPYLLNPDFCIIGATTTKEYRIFEKDPAFERRFDVVKIDEPSVPEAIEILKGLKTTFEKFHNIQISDNVIETCVLLSQRYIATSSLPDKCIDILDEACAKLEVLNCSQKTLTVNDIRKIITEKTGIPVSNITSNESANLLTLSTTLKEKIIGQSSAIDTIVHALKRARLDLQDSNRPLASFLFAGTTGVGKTETAKVLANEYFGDPNALIRFDMSEYQGKETVQRLTGSSPGYVGYEEGGQLTNAVKAKPYCVVLFDEIEKAHSDVLDILLQILDDGRLTDGSGITVNFKNTLIILTTNIGATSIQKNPLGFGKDDSTSNIEAIAMSELKKELRPELINRLTNIVVYNSLSQTDCEKIVALYLKQFVFQLKQKGITLITEKGVPKKVVSIGYNKTYGAREIKRTFERMVVDPIADLILSDISATKIHMNSTLNCSIISTKHYKKSY